LFEYTDDHSYILLEQFDYYVMTNLRDGGGGGDVKGKQNTIASPLRATPALKPAASSKLNYLPLISAVKEYGLVSSNHTRKLSYAHALLHCNRALHIRKSLNPLINRQEERLG
jgi:hypothetical protein